MLAGRSGRVMAGGVGVVVGRAAAESWPEVFCPRVNLFRVARASAPVWWRRVTTC